MSPVPEVTRPVALVLIVHYLNGSASSEAAAKRIAEKLNAQAELRPEPAASPSALIRYVDEQDHAVARSIARALGEMGYGWRIEKGRNQFGNGLGPIRVEVWLPRNKSAKRVFGPVDGKRPMRDPEMWSEQDNPP